MVVAAVAAAPGPGWWCPGLWVQPPCWAPRPHLAVAHPTGSVQALLQTLPSPRRGRATCWVQPGLRERGQEESGLGPDMGTLEGGEGGRARRAGGLCVVARGRNRRAGPSSPPALVTM